MDAPFKAGDRVHVLNAFRLPKVEEVVSTQTIERVTEEGGEPLYWLSGGGPARSARVLRHPCEARVVYERQDAYDMASGPHGYERVGFAIGDRVFWTGCAGSGLPGGSYEADKRLAEAVVARWNAHEGE